MRLPLILAWRSLRQHTRRTFLTGLAILLGVWSAIVLSAIARGAAETMARNTIMNLIGHVLIQDPPYVTDPVISHRFSFPADVYTAMQADPRIKGIAKRLRIPAVISSERESAAV